MIYDAAIIGTGPAGLSAAINLTQLGKSIVWFGSAQFSHKVEKSELIANYPGIPYVTGPELNAHFRSHVEKMALPITDKMVTNIMPMGDRFMLLAENDMFEAKTLLLATGVNATKGFQGESELLGRGVSYCATCDGFLYRGKTIAVYCGAKRFEHEIAYLAGMAEKVYLYAGYRDCDLTLPNVERLPMPIRTVKGQSKVDGIILSDGSEYAVDGLFCLRNAVAPTTLLPGIELDGAHIVVDRQLRTNIPGCFAAGDCTGLPYQLAKAVGEGNVAAHSMVEYMAQQA